MYSELYSVISTRLTELGFASVATAIGETPSLPAVQPFFAGDKEVTKETLVIREISHIIKVTVGHNDLPGGAQEEMATMLDTIQSGFAGWRPPNLVGIQRSYSVPEIKISDFKDHGALEYLVFLRLRVNPAVFRKN